MVKNTYIEAIYYFSLIKLTLFMFLRKYSHNIYKVQVVLFLVFIFLTIVYYNYPQAHRFFNRIWCEKFLFLFWFILFSFLIMTMLFACFFWIVLVYPFSFFYFLYFYENGMEKDNCINSLLSQQALFANFLYTLYPYNKCLRRGENKIQMNS